MDAWKALLLERKEDGGLSCYRPMEKYSTDVLGAPRSHAVPALPIPGPEAHHGAWGSLGRQRLPPCTRARGSPSPAHSTAWVTRGYRGMLSPLTDYRRTFAAIADSSAPAGWACCSP